MNKAKYIVIDEMIPIIFSEILTHADVARALCNSMQKVTSAGFVYINSNGQYSTYGDSFSLKIKSAPGDARLLNSTMGGADA